MSDVSAAAVLFIGVIFIVDVVVILLIGRIFVIVHAFISDYGWRVLLCAARTRASLLLDIILVLIRLRCVCSSCSVSS